MRYLSAAEMRKEVFMKFRFPLGLTITFSCVALCVTAQSTSPETSLNAPKQDAPSFRREDHPYHKHLPKQPLPETLDPEQFRDKPQSYAAYKLASEIPALLYQQPCLCACGKERGHKSLHDCFAGLHGRNCDECKVEVFFCYEQHKKGWSAKKIRDAMFQFKFLQINFTEYARAQWQVMTGNIPNAKE
jgi:hypothetical protein